MADAMEMLTGLTSHLWVIVFGVAIGGATVWLPYGKIAGVLKWLALFLFAYIFTAIVVDPGLAGGPEGHHRPDVAQREGCLGHARGDSRHDDQSLPVLLAIVAGSRGREIHRAAPDHRADRRFALRAHDAQARHRRGHVLLEHRDVLHHRHHCVHAAHARRHPHRDHAAGGRGASPAGGPGMFSAFHGRCDRNGAAGHSDALGFGRYALAETFGWKQGLG